jgi:RNA polymerase-binding protein DksA
MNEQLTEHFRRRLGALAESVRGDVESIQEVAFQGSGGQAAGNLSNAPMHLGDSGTEEYLNQLSTTLLGHEEQLSQQISQALNRLAAGTYGTCETCGKQIAVERLEALPFASQCIACASQAATIPPPNLNVGRPLQPSDTMAPEGDMGESRRRGSGKFEEAEALSSRDERADAERLADVHAVGTPGGGDALGGLAGSNVGRGDPQVGDIEDAMGDGSFDAEPDKQITRPRDKR